MNSSGAVFDVLLRQLFREVVAEYGVKLLGGVRQLLAEELARFGIPNSNTEAQYVSVKQAAKIASVHESTIRSWLKSGMLRGYHPEPRILRVRVDELHATMARRPNGPDGQVIDFDDRVRVLTARAARFNK